MQVEIQKWGNSAAIRLPATILRDAGVTLGQVLDVTIADKKLVFSPKVHYKLEDLVAKINPDNCHALLLDDSLRGNEIS